MTDEIRDMRYKCVRIANEMKLLANNVENGQTISRKTFIDISHKCVDAFEMFEKILSQANAQH